jgi:sugar transferase (PEP-CTERM/EpsH1 system associated)
MAKPVRILQVVLSLEVGGLERVVLDLINHATADFSFVICCLDAKGALSSGITRPNTKVVLLGRHPGLDLSLSFRIASLARKENIQIIHTHNAAAHLYGSMGGKLAGLRVLHTEHGKQSADLARGYRANRVAALFTDVNVAVSEKIRRETISFEKVPVNRVVLIPNGIDIDKYGSHNASDLLRNKLSLKPESLIIGTVGRLAPVKNYPLLLRTFIRIADDYPHVHLVFVGDGPMQSELESVAARAEDGKLQTTPEVTRSRIHFLGQRDDVAELLACMDVFVLCSYSEGHSIALLEAMATGCPIVATAVGGNPELIEDGRTGLLVPSGDATALAGAMVRLLSDRDLATRLGQQARQKAISQYSVRTMTSRYEELWRTLAAQ